MPKSIYVLSGRFKSILFIFVIICILLLLIYTQWLVRNLREDSRKIVVMWAGLLEKIASEETDQQSDTMVNFLFEGVVQRINFPAILTDSERNPTYWRNLGIPEDEKSDENTEIVKRTMRSMAKENEPILVRSGDLEFGYIYYGDSRLITHLRYLPYVEIGIVGLFALVGFIGFNSIKRSEQRFIWVGMAKETAHQLGTPISSLMGWIDLLKEGKTLDEARQTVKEMSKDVKRLEKVAARFSQIGSKEDLKVQELNPIIMDVANYLRRRLPKMETKTHLVEEYEDVRNVAINKDLFEWALENLVKNSLDAVRETGGTVKIVVGSSDKGKTVCVDVIDNGRGIEPKNRKNIFKPGFSTKKRGWGLGLNLSQRIIEEYHHGSLFLKDSKVGEGTTMRIMLQ